MKTAMIMTFIHSFPVLALMQFNPQGGTVTVAIAGTSLVETCLMIACLSLLAYRNWLKRERDWSLMLLAIAIGLNLVRYLLTIFGHWMDLLDLLTPTTFATGTQLLGGSAWLVMVIVCWIGFTKVQQTIDVPIAK